MSARKVHPRGLPHLADATSGTGKVDHEALAKGQEAWNEELKSGRYTIIKTDEVALDENHDMLYLIRRKNN